MGHPDIILTTSKNSKREEGNCYMCILNNQREFILTIESLDANPREERERPQVKIKYIQTKQNGHKTEIILYHR